MASSSCLLCSSKVVAARDLSSAASSAFAPPSSTLPLSCAHPISKPSSRLSTVKCSLSDEEQAPSSVGRRALAGVVATGAALAVFTNMAVAAQGPGQEGARRVAEKADKLLKAADKLNIDEAPERFGPGRSGDDPTKISQIAGSGLTDSKKSLKQGASDAAKSISETTKNVKSNTGGGWFGFGKKAESTADDAKNAATDVQRKITRDGLGRIREVQNKASDAIEQAQSKTKIGNSGGNVLSTLQEGLQGLREGVQQSSADVKSSVDKALP